MQEIFGQNVKTRRDFISLISRERFARYLAASNGDEAEAIKLYCWNMRIAQSLYVYLQCWEVALRNRFNGFLSWKYKSNWPYDEARFVRNLTSDDKRRLTETKSRQERDRKVTPVSTPAIVADLSAGFWVSLLSKRYDVPYSWRHNISRVFPHDQALDRQAAWEKCDRILTLRNRVAHHEPIYSLPLEDLYQDVEQLVGAMSPAMREFARASCNFRQVWELWHSPAKAQSGETP
ncbi:MAG TPA: Abi family protein [Ensifer sp.]|nr:Abi family protein [Ensifer sp.]